MKRLVTATMLAGSFAAFPALAQEGPGDVMGGFREPIDFAVIDTDGNGILTRAELQTRATARLSRADLNNDGNLDRAELVAIFPAPPGRFLAVFSADPTERMADRLIALLGGTESGSIPVAALADRRVNALLAVADTDNNAEISVAEADMMAQKLDRGPRHGGPKDGPMDGPRGHGDWMPEGPRG